MSSLILPDRVAPTNLRLVQGSKVRFIEHDLFDIAMRLKHRHPSIYVLEVEKDAGADPEWIIMEDCKDGVQRLIFRGVKQLDGRVLRKIDEIMHLDFDERVRKLEAEAYKIEEDRQEVAFEKLYEEMGRPMWTQMEHDGFIQRPVSYPKVGVAKPGKAR